MIRIPSSDATFTIVSGLFGITLLASIWAFWFPIDIGFHFILLSLSLFFGNKNKENIKAVVKDAYTQLKTFNKPVKLLFYLSSLLILAQCATVPYIIDNETYYIQTIKWLNEYGFVKGLANLHLFFGQTSGWHITQSVYSLSFLYDRFNDLNGFLLLLVNFFAFKKWQEYTIHHKRNDLLFGLIPLTYVFIFQFISAPSPDLAVYLLSFLLFSCYLDKSDSLSTQLKQMSVIALFSVYIKITAVVLLIIPLLVFVKHYKKTNNEMSSIKILSGLTFTIFLLKNTILTGYPLFPLQFKVWPDLNYQVPTAIMNFFFSKNMLHSFYIPFNAYADVSVIYMIKQYFFHSGIDSIMALISLAVLLLFPLMSNQFDAKKRFWTIYGSFVLLITLLCFSSPQYRFYIHFTLFFALLLLTTVLKNQKTIQIFQVSSLIIVALLLFRPVSFKHLTNNPLLADNSYFHIKNIIQPEPNTKYPLEFKGDSRGNFKFHTPVDPPLFWMNGNGELPCVNSEQLNYFETNFHYMPQQRSHNLADGFYSQKLTGHD
ncbi:hypothetical protein EZL74_09540 [Flavobacterium silvisoli]|uniref:DUF8201 domain-containing protein n=2 Tax=Flavobacterium silvisoli TaxID=2529433 RepID=A0A4Q9Z183_9FLAO|nr:hypothetical protein [Flavobacterium silvisoli]TBX67503.1 hypothetical protein EZL74_09540 [Flavobacterium silvisoli]